jgi:hypothetical protein
MLHPSFSRESRLRILAELCISNNLNPNRGNYAGFIQKICVTHLNTSLTTAKELTTALSISYRTDQWKSLLSDQDENDSYEETSGYELNRLQLTPPQATTQEIEPEKTQLTIQRKSMQQEIKQLAQKTQPQPVKTVEHQQATQPDKLTPKQIAKIFYGVAQRDTFNGVGRIILSDARNITDNKHLQISDLQTLWQTHYPLIDCEVRSNTLAIYWDGKDTIRLQRNLNTIIQPKTPVFKPKNNPLGDIDEDDDGVVPETEAT